MARFIIVGIVTLFGFIGNSQIQEAQARQQILRATVQISMIVPQLADMETVEVEPLPVPPDEYRTIAKPENYVLAEGLGTVVISNGRYFLITHDHWSQLEADLGKVQFRSAEGSLLLEMDLYRFKQLILSRNDGAMVLTAPAALQNLAISAEKSGTTDDGEILLAHRQNGQVFLSPVELKEAGLKEGLDVWRLEGQTVVSGDSGGGVWQNGRMAATMWTTVMTENVITGQRQVTDQSIAAIISIP